MQITIAPPSKAWLDVFLVLALFCLVILMASELWEKSMKYYATARVVEETIQCAKSNGTPHLFCGPSGFYQPYGLVTWDCRVNKTDG